MWMLRLLPGMGPGTEAPPHKQTAGKTMIKLKPSAALPPANVNAKSIGALFTTQHTDNIWFLTNAPLTKRQYGHSEPFACGTNRLMKEDASVFPRDRQICYAPCSTSGSAPLHLSMTQNFTRDCFAKYRCELHMETVEAYLCCSPANCPFKNTGPGPVCTLIKTHFCLTSRTQWTCASPAWGSARLY